MWRWVGALMGMLGFMHAAGWAQPSTPTVIAQVGNTVGGKTIARVWGVLALTDQGEVVYSADVQGPSGTHTALISTTQGVLLSEEGQSIGGGKGRLLQANLVGMTGQDVPVFLGSYNPPAGVADALFTPTQWLLDTLTPFPFTTMIDGHPLHVMEDAAVNQSGRVIYRGLTDDPVSHAALFGLGQVGGGWLVFPGQVIGGLPITGVLWGPVQNAAGTVLFQATLNLQQTQQGLFTAQNKVAVYGDLVQGHPILAFWEFFLNDPGEIVYHVTLETGEVIVSTQRGVLIQEGQSFAGHTLTRLDEVLALNNQGEVLFLAEYDTTQYGLFSTTRGLVFTEGQPLLGHTLDGIGTLALNNAGALAVTVTWDRTSPDLSILLFPPAPGTPPSPLVAQVTGDFNGDGYADLAGIAAWGAIWQCLAGQPCTQLPGRAQDLVTGDFTGDGHDDLVARAGDSTLWALTDGQTWQRLPGMLKEIVAGHYTSTQHAQLAGVAWDSTIWLSPQLGQWQQLPGRLKTMVTGDFDGDGQDDLAGLAWDSTIWVMLHGQPWKQLPGRLWTLDVVAGTPDALEGSGFDGSRWIAYALGQWQPVTSSAQR